MKKIAGIFTSAAILAASAGAQDDASEVSTEAVYACASMADDSARLACYDAAVGRLQAAEEAGEITTITRAEVEEVKRDSFGFSIPSLPALSLPRLGGSDDEDDELEEVSLAVASTRIDGNGKVVVTLENGQIWRQTDSTYVRIPRAGIEQAEIRRAAFGSYRMRLDNSRLFRARREE